MKVHEVSTLKVVMVPIHREGYPFIALFALAALVLFWIWQPLGWIGVFLTGWCTYFFRDPRRFTPSRDGLVISPADGLVQMIGKVPPPPELEMGDEPMTRVSIFMNVFNVHVNRSPMDGRIVKMAYRPGKFVNAALDKASEDNERMAIRLETNENKGIAFVQIAGLVARRIKWDVAEGQELRAGERFGMIRFGSRVDVFLPEGVEPLVSLGQTAIAGETVLADVRSQESAREAVGI